MGRNVARTIERLVREGPLARQRRAADERDLKIINTHAGELNAETADALEHQIDR